MYLTNKNYCSLIIELAIKLCIYFKQIMKNQLILVILASFLLAAGHCQNMVDFTYSQLDHQQGKVAKSQGIINIKPDRQIIQGYSFPDACYLARKLEQQKIEDSRDLSGYDMDSMIDALKIDFIQMLKTSEKIKKKKGNIQELSQVSGRSQNITVVSPRDLQTLKKHEQKLKAINDEIKAKSQQLQSLVKQSMKNSNSNQFALNSINYQIQTLKLKIDYLKTLRRGANDADIAKNKDQYDRYFNDLKVKFNQQNELIDDLNTILKNFNQIGALRAQINHLKGKIDIANLMIEEKEACAKERDEIKNFQRNDHEIKIQMANLREKKKDKSNINNKYCQGVAKKLEDRIKKVLLSYDYTFQCAQGLDQLRRQRDNDRDQLAKAQRRLRQLQDGAGIDDFKRKFEVNRQYIKSKQDELSRFAMPAYHHDIHQLDRLISKAENDLEDAIQRKKGLGTPTGTGEVDHRKIQELVTRIKKLKGTYCQQYQAYDSKAQSLWKLVYKYESQVQFNSKIRGIYEQEINELRDLQSTFEALRSKILKRIE